MEREELIKQCRYYKGESDCPFYDALDGRFWNYERFWVNWCISGDSFLLEMVDEYTRRGLADFHTEIPITLRAILYNRYDHWAQGGEEDFKIWFVQDYFKAEERK